MLKNAYLDAKIGFDTAENDPCNFQNLSSLQGFNFQRAVVSRSSRTSTTILSRSRISSQSRSASSSWRSTPPGGPGARRGASCPTWRRRTSSRPCCTPGPPPRRSPARSRASPTGARPCPSRPGAARTAPCYGYSNSKLEWIFKFDQICYKLF